MLTLAVLLFAFSPWAVVILIGAGLPSFFAEAKFSGDAFRLFRWRSPETRMQMYLETVIAREDSVKEVKLFQLGPKLLQRYRAIFNRLFVEDRALTIRRDTWGFLLGLILTVLVQSSSIALSVIVPLAEGEGEAVPRGGESLARPVIAPRVVVVGHPQIGELGPVAQGGGLGGVGEPAVERHVGAEGRCDRAPDAGDQRVAVRRGRERSERRAEEVSDRIRAVEQVSEDLFDEWEDELAQYLLEQHEMILFGEGLSILVEEVIIPILRGTSVADELTDPHRRFNWMV